MSGPIEQHPLNVITLVRLIASLQVALAKLLKELLTRSVDQRLFVFKDGDGRTAVLDESCGDPLEHGATVDELCEPFESWADKAGLGGLQEAGSGGVDESCGEGAINGVDESCGEGGGAEEECHEVEMLCENIIRIAVYVKRICWIVRRLPRG